jgi:NADH:ubiquinone oxidoreductase subunit 6 (subunit J)
MDPTTTQAAVSLAPAVGALAFVWTTSSVLTVRHAALQTSTQYTLTVSTVARDASDPGITLAAPYVVVFTTSATGAVTANAGGPYTGIAGSSVQLDGSGSTPASAIVEYTWEITAPGGAISFASGEQPTVQFSAVGQYSILLTVRDAFDNTDTDTTTLTITASVGSNFLADYWWIFVILILAVIGALIFVLAKRKKKEEEPMPPEVPPEQVETMPPSRTPARGPPPPLAPAHTVAPPGKPTTRECPTCGTIVDVVDTECFMCGSKL